MDCFKQAMSSTLACCFLNLRGQTTYSYRVDKAKSPWSLKLRIKHGDQVVYCMISRNWEGEVSLRVVGQAVKPLEQLWSKAYGFWYCLLMNVLCDMLCPLISLTDQDWGKGMSERLTGYFWPSGHVFLLLYVPKTTVNADKCLVPQREVQHIPRLS